MPMKNIDKCRQKYMTQSASTSISGISGIFKLAEQKMFSQMWLDLPS